MTKKKCQPKTFRKTDNDGSFSFLHAQSESVSIYYAAVFRENMSIKL